MRTQRNTIALLCIFFIAGSCAGSAKPTASFNVCPDLYALMTDYHLEIKDILVKKSQNVIIKKVSDDGVKHKPLFNLFSAMSPSIKYSPSLQTAVVTMPFLIECKASKGDEEIDATCFIIATIGFDRFLKEWDENGSISFEVINIVPIPFEEVQKKFKNEQK